MKHLFALAVFASITLSSTLLSAQAQKPAKEVAKNTYIDVHHLGAGKVTIKEIEEAHKKDIETQGKYGVTFLKYWFDAATGDVYCLSTSSSTEAISKTHAEAHGLLPAGFYQVTAGQEEHLKGKNSLYLDVHELGEGKVTANDVAEAHQKDLAVQKKYGVNLINYWVDEKKGIVMCLAQAPDSLALINTHREAHGLIPDKVVKVKQGQ
ncbi:MAG TPA: DUF4242 domain-containing protein [Chitinophagaceae bacterium]